MSRNRDDRYSHRYDDWDDADEDYEGWEGDGFTSSSLVEYDESHMLPAGFTAEASPEPLIIPGAGLPHYTGGIRRRRPFTMQILLISIATCVVLSALFSVVPVGGTGGDNLFSPFTALANTFVFKNKAFVSYTVRSGDTFDSIAAQHHVQLGGIYEANKLNADAEALVGEHILVPTDPNYGANYVAPLPPGLNIGGYSYPPRNYRDKNNHYLFNAVSGQTNEPDGICAPNANIANGNIATYELFNPQNGEGSHWVRGFTPFHSGVDMSTGGAPTPLYAAQDGTVIFVDFDTGGGGFSVKINLCNGLAVSYSHMIGETIAIKEGQNVHKGDVIGYQGSTGHSSGPHLHYMLWWKNVPFDPLCGYNDLVGGYGVGSFHYNGCPPNLGHNSWP